MASIRDQEQRAIGTFVPVALTVAVVASTFHFGRNTPCGSFNPAGNFINDLGKIGEEVKILLNVQQLLIDEELSQVRVSEKETMC